MTIEVKIIADSISPQGKRLTTYQLRYPRFIHAEFMTHRMFSRNASSSRAIPVAKMIEDLRRDPVMPVYWGSNKPGMQAGAELDEETIKLVKHEWISAMEEMIWRVEGMIEYNLHKQIANRLLEPWAHINVVVTATEWDNFFALRYHPAAQPEIMELAKQMWEAMKASEPEELFPGEWHLPFIVINDKYAISKKYWGSQFEYNTEEVIDDLKKISTARCARVSYLTHDGKETTPEEDLALFQKLLVDTPLHASPAEHQATPDTYDQADAMLSRHAGGGKEFSWEPEWNYPHQHGNFVGWRQHRKMLPNENVSKFDGPALSN